MSPNDPNSHDMQVLSSDNTYDAVIVMRCFMIKGRPVIPCTPVSWGTLFPSLTSHGNWPHLSTCTARRHRVIHHSSACKARRHLSSACTGRRHRLIHHSSACTARRHRVIHIRRHAWPVDIAWLHSSSFNSIILQINFYTILDARTTFPRARNHFGDLSTLHTSDGSMNIIEESNYPYLTIINSLLFSLAMALCNMQAQDIIHCEVYSINLSWLFLLYDMQAILSK